MKRLNKIILITGVIIISLLGFMVLAWNYKTGSSTSFLMAWILLFINLSAMAYLLREFILMKHESSSVAEEEEKTEEDIAPPPGPQPIKEYINPTTVLTVILKGTEEAKNIPEFGEVLLRNLAHEVDIMQGIFYAFDPENDDFRITSTYAFVSNEEEINNFKKGEGITGQAAIENKVTLLSEIPEDYRIISSGLGKRKPSFIYFVPLRNKHQSGLLEFSTFKKISESRAETLEKLMDSGGEIMEKIAKKSNLKA